MKRFARSHKILSTVLVLVCLIGVLIGWDLSAKIRGQMVAHLDVARGHYEILVLGLPMAWRPEYGRLLRERYGIEMRVVAGCVVSESLLAYTSGYNAVSERAVNLKFRRDVFKETALDVSRTSKPAAASVH